MEQKTKIIIISLAAVALLFLGLSFWYYNSASSLQRNLDDLKNEKEKLSASFERSKQEIRNLQSQKDSLSQEINRLNQDMSAVENKYELANRAKEELIEKLRAKEAEMSKSSGRAEVMVPQTSDEYWAGVVKAKTDLEFQLGTLRVELKSIQIANEQLQRDKGSMELDLATLKRERDDLKRQMDYNKKIMDSISEELVREKNDRIQMQDGYKTVKNENMLLARQLRGLNTRKIALERKVQDLQESKNKVDARFSEMETMLTQKISQVDELKNQLDSIKGAMKSGSAPVKQEEQKESVELPPIVVRPQPGASTPGEEEPSLSAKVVAVNRDNNFIIINKGQEAGVQEGDRFRVYRDGDFIADVEVIQVRKVISACDIKKEQGTVRIGDTAR